MKCVKPYQATIVDLVPQILFADPIHRINIKDFIRQHLQHAIVSSGGQDVFQNDWLLNVDQDVVRSFGALAVL